MTDMPIPTDDVFGAVKRVYEQMEGMGPLLQDPKRSSIRIVLNPERMVINESQRLYTYLSLFGFPVDAVIANRVLPEEARSTYFDRWFAHPGRPPRRRARRPSTPCPSSRRRLFDREMVGTRDARRVRPPGLRRRTDPTAVLHAEQAHGGEEGGPRLRALPAAAVRREGRASRSSPRGRARRPGGQPAPAPRAAAHAGRPAGRERRLRATSGCAWPSGAKEAS